MVILVALQGQTGKHTDVTRCIISLTGDTTMSTIMNCKTWQFYSRKIYQSLEKNVHRDADFTHRHFMVRMVVRILNIKSN